MKLDQVTILSLQNKIRIPKSNLCSNIVLYIIQAVFKYSVSRPLQIKFE